MHEQVRRKTEVRRKAIKKNKNNFNRLSVNKARAKILPCASSLGNFISTAEKIRLPDDCTIGYIIEALLEVTLTHSNLFHSHLENLQRLPTDTVLEQVREGRIDVL